MRYVTTRNQTQVYLPRQTLFRDRGDDGGLFLPQTWPDLSLKDLADLPFTGRIAHTLNRLLDTAISQWDVDFCVGRHPVGAREVGQKITLVRCWHNQQDAFSFLVRTLAARLRQEGEARATDWVEVAVRLAVLAAVFAEDADTSRDVAVPAGGLHGLMSAWYGRELGLPIGNIVLCCNENGHLWELLHRGQLRTDALSVATDTPEGDVAVPVGLERLVCAAGGPEAVEEYREAVRRGGVYAPGEELLQAMGRGIFVSVVSARRMEADLRGLYARGTLSGPYEALCHGGVMDYRAATGENRSCLIFSGRGPGLDRAVVERILAVSPERQINWEERE